MANYLLLYSGGKMPESETEQKAVLKEWDVWFGKLAGALVDGGNPFTPMAKIITTNGKISDGPVDCSASGYSIIKAVSLDAAVALAKGCPVLKSGARVSADQTRPSHAGRISGIIAPT